MELLQTYPYLVGNLANLALFALAALCAPADVRRFALSGATLALPCALQAKLDTPAYWNPVRLFTIGGIGVEDFLCAFSLAGIACVLAAWPLRGACRLARSPRGAFVRYLVIVAAGLGSRLMLQAFSTPVSTALVGSTASLAAAMLFLTPTRWRLAFAGACCFTPVYFLIVYVSFTLSPGYRAQWNLPALWGPTVAGIPLDELVWGLCLGTAWPLATAYVFQGRSRAPQESG